MCDASEDENRVRNYGDPRCCLDGISFIESFWIADAPADLEEVEAAIDAEPPCRWELWARRGVLLFTVVFWATVVWLFLR